MDESCRLVDAFRAWIPLRKLNLDDFPNCGDCVAVYALRDSRSGEILKFGETGLLRRRILVNFVGASAEATPRRQHSASIESYSQTK